MSGKSTRLVIVANGAKGAHQSIEARIERRLDLLRSWLRDGIPINKHVPKNLKETRVWGDPELGIAPISSPNEFTTTHHRYGSLVREIAGLLAALKRRSTSSTKKARPKKSASLEKFDRNAFDRQLESAVSQWHTERNRRLHEEKRADAAEARSILLLEENAKKDSLIADLRRQLVAREELRVVK